MLSSHKPLGMLNWIWEAHIRKIDTKKSDIASEIKIIGRWGRGYWGYSIEPHSPRRLRQHRQVHGSHNYKLHLHSSLNLSDWIYQPYDSAFLGENPRKMDMCNKTILGVIGKREYENYVVWMTLQACQFK